MSTVEIDTAEYHARLAAYERRYLQYFDRFEFPLWADCMNDPNSDPLTGEEKERFAQELRVAICYRLEGEFDCAPDPNAQDFPLVQDLREPTGNPLVIESIRSWLKDYYELDFYPKAQAARA